MRGRLLESPFGKTGLNLESHKLVAEKSPPPPLLIKRGKKSKNEGF
jgi:hypothetical protein